MVTIGVIVDLDGVIICEKAEPQTVLVDPKYRAQRLKGYEDRTTNLVPWCLTRCSVARLQNTSRMQ